MFDLQPNELSVNFKIISNTASYTYKIPVVLSQKLKLSADNEDKLRCGQKTKIIEWSPDEKTVYKGKFQLSGPLNTPNITFFGKNRTSDPNWRCTVELTSHQYAELKAYEVTALAPYGFIIYDKELGRYLPATSQELGTVHFVGDHRLDGNEQLQLVKGHEFRKILHHQKGGLPIMISLSRENQAIRLNPKYSYMVNAEEYEKYLPSQLKVNDLNQACQCFLLGNDRWLPLIKEFVEKDQLPDLKTLNQYHSRFSSRRLLALYSALNLKAENVKKVLSLYNNKTAYLKQNQTEVSIHQVNLKDQVVRITDQDRQLRDISINEIHTPEEQGIHLRTKNRIRAPRRALGIGRF